MSGTPEPAPVRPRALLTREEAPASFQLHSPYEPRGDQPRAIAELSEGLVRGDKSQVLLGVTGVLIARPGLFEMGDVKAVHNYT